MSRWLGLPSPAAFYALSEAEQDEAIERWLTHQSECQKCGHPRDVCGDPEREWFPQRSVCFASMEREAAQAAYEDLHDKAPYHDGTFTRWAKKRSRETPYHHGHGVTIYPSLEDVDPGDHFTTEPEAQPRDLRPDDSEEGRPWT